MNDINGGHKGKEIYIIGGGPSLKGFDFRLLDDKVTIACNKALLYLTPTYLVYMDDQFYKWHKSDISAFKGQVFTHSWNPEHVGVIQTTNLGPLGLSDDFNEGLFHGGNAGYLALNLAYIMGGNPIYLLGIDMCYDNGRTHFHNGYDKEDNIGEERFLHMMRGFNYGAEILKERGITVYNCSDISRLECFEKMTLNNLMVG